MRARLLLTFTLLLGLACTSSTEPQVTERPAFRVEERFGRLLLINDWYQPLHAMVADVDENGNYSDQLCTVEACVAIAVGDAHAFDYEAILDGRKSGTVRLFTWWEYTVAGTDSVRRGVVRVDELKVGPALPR